MRTLFLLFFLTLSFTVMAQDTIDVLLIGTFHFNNPGADVAQTKGYDILSEKSQKELEQLALALADFDPDHIFVEWNYDEQSELDSLYERYLLGEDFTLSSKDDFYRKSEIFQLAFRTGKYANTEKITGIDYSTNFPFDSLMSVLDSKGQTALKDRLIEDIMEMTESINSKFSENISISDMLLYLNQSSIREEDIKLYMNIINEVGDLDNHVGAYLTSEWYKRNIYMMSFVQKRLNPEDKKILILLGNSHVAVINKLLKDNPKWNVVELKDILEN